MSTGALTPQKAVETIYNDGLHHLDEPTQLAFFKNVIGGLQVGVAGLTSMIVAGGCPSIKAANPGITHFIEGALFSTALISVYFTGGELFTGYPMWLSIAALQRQKKPRQYVTAVVVSLIGNFVGTFISSALFTYATGALEEEPWRSYLIERVDETILGTQWHRIFFKAIACGYAVTLAMLLGTQNMDGISKALSLWLPFTLVTASQFPHTVEYMHLAVSSMLYGGELTVAKFLWKCMLPIILGNSVGGAVFTGLYHWWVFLKCHNGERKSGSTFGEAITEYGDDELE